MTSLNPSKLIHSLKTAKKKILCVFMGQIFFFGQVAFGYLPLQNASIQRQLLIPQSDPIYIIQDIHNHLEAQQNILSVLEDLRKNSGKKSIKVGVEGAAGSFNFNPYHLFPDPNLTKIIGDEFLTEGLISAPEQFGLRHRDGFIMEGIEKSSLYRKNVKAYRESQKHFGEIKAALRQKELEINQQKKEIFPKDLYAFDELVTKYENGQIDLAIYLANLKNYSNEPYFLIETFLEAHKIEKTLSIRQANAEREFLLKNLLEKLSSTELKKLKRKIRKLSELGKPDSQRMELLAKLANQKGLSITKLYAFNQYIHYLKLSEAINPEKLFQEIRLSKINTYKALSKGKSNKVKQLIEHSKWLNLTKKLIEFKFTPEDWNEYKNLNTNKIKLSQVSHFEDFYKTAEKRDKWFADYILTRNIDVVVVGGFHTPGIASALEKKEKPYIILRPKISSISIGEGTSYLTEFAQKQTFLERIFQDRELFLPLPPSLAVIPLIKIKRRNNLRSIFSNRYLERAPKIIKQKAINASQALVNRLSGPEIIREIPYTLPLVLGIATRNLPLIVVGLVTQLIIYPMLHPKDGLLRKRMVTSIYFTGAYFMTYGLLFGPTFGLSLSGWEINLALAHQLSSISGLIGVVIAHNLNNLKNPSWAKLLPIEPVMMNMNDDSDSTRKINYANTSAADVEKQAEKEMKEAILVWVQDKKIDSIKAVFDIFNDTDPANDANDEQVTAIRDGFTLAFNTLTEEEFTSTIKEGMDNSYRNFLATKGADAKPIQREINFYATMAQIFHGGDATKDEQFTESRMNLRQNIIVSLIHLVDSTYDKIPSDLTTRQNYSKILIQLARDLINTGYNVNGAQLALMGIRLIKPGDEADKILPELYQAVHAGFRSGGYKLKAVLVGGESALTYNYSKYKALNRKTDEIVNFINEIFVFSDDVFQIHQHDRSRRYLEQAVSIYENIPDHLRKDVSPTVMSKVRALLLMNQAILSRNPNEIRKKLKEAKSIISNLENQIEENENYKYSDRSTMNIVPALSTRLSVTYTMVFRHLSPEDYADVLVHLAESDLDSTERGLIYINTSLNLSASTLNENEVDSPENLGGSLEPPQPLPADYQPTNNHDQLAVVISALVDHFGPHNNGFSFDDLIEKVLDIGKELEDAKASYSSRNWDIEDMGAAYNFTILLLAWLHLKRNKKGDFEKAAEYTQFIFSAHLPHPRSFAPVHGYFQRLNFDFKEFFTVKKSGQTVFEVLLNKEKLTDELQDAKSPKVIEDKEKQGRLVVANFANFIKTLSSAEPSSQTTRAINKAYNNGKSCTLCLQPSENNSDWPGLEPLRNQIRHSHLMFDQETDLTMNTGESLHGFSRRAHNMREALGNRFQNRTQHFINEPAVRLGMGGLFVEASELLGYAQSVIEKNEKRRSNSRIHLGQYTSNRYSYYRVHYLRMAGRFRESLIEGHKMMKGIKTLSEPVQENTLLNYLLTLRSVANDSSWKNQKQVRDEIQKAIKILSDLRPDFPKAQIPIVFELYHLFFTLGDIVGMSQTASELTSLVDAHDLSEHEKGDQTISWIVNSHINLRDWHLINPSLPLDQRLKHAYEENKKAMAVDINDGSTETYSKIVTENAVRDPQNYDSDKLFEEIDEFAGSDSIGRVLGAGLQMVVVDTVAATPPDQRASAISKARNIFKKLNEWTGDATEHTTMLAEEFLNFIEDALNSNTDSTQTHNRFVQYVIDNDTKSNPIPISNSQINPWRLASVHLTEPHSNKSRSEIVHMLDAVPSNLPEDTGIINIAQTIQTYVTTRDAFRSEALDLIENNADNLSSAALRRLIKLLFYTGEPKAVRYFDTIGMRNDVKLDRTTQEFLSETGSKSLIALAEESLSETEWGVRIKHLIDIGATGQAEEKYDEAKKRFGEDFGNGVFQAFENKKKAVLIQTNLNEINHILIDPSIPIPGRLSRTRGLLDEAKQFDSESLFTLKARETALNSLANGESPVEFIRYVIAQEHSPETLLENGIPQTLIDLALSIPSPSDRESALKDISDYLSNASSNPHPDLAHRSKLAHEWVDSLLNNNPDQCQVCQTGDPSEVVSERETNAWALMSWHMSGDLEKRSRTLERFVKSMKEQTKNNSYNDVSLWIIQNPTLRQAFIESASDVMTESLSLLANQDIRILIEILARVAPPSIVTTFDQVATQTKTKLKPNIKNILEGKGDSVVKKFEATLERRDWEERLDNMAAINPTRGLQMLRDIRQKRFGSEFGNDIEHRLKRAKDSIQDIKKIQRAMTLAEELLGKAQYDQAHEILQEYSPEQWSKSVNDMIQENDQNESSVATRTPIGNYLSSIQNLKSDYIKLMNAVKIFRTAWDQYQNNRDEEALLTISTLAEGNGIEAAKTTLRVYVENFAAARALLPEKIHGNNHQNQNLKALMPKPQHYDYHMLMMSGWRTLLKKQTNNLRVPSKCLDRFKIILLS